MTPPRRKAAVLTDLQASIVDYVSDSRAGGFGRPLEVVAAELSSPGAPISAADIKGWCALAARPARLDDPLGNEMDEDKRAAMLEERWAVAAESVPGAAELIGMDRFRAAAVVTADLSGSGPPPELAEVVGKMLDFLVPEIAAARWVISSSEVYLPEGGSWDVWEVGVKVKGESRVLRSTLVLFDGDGKLCRLLRWTRPMPGGPRKLKGGTYLRVRRAKMSMKADLRAIAQRLVQVALEFRPGRHDRLSQKELAVLCDRTKQAISHQRGVIAKNVLAATGGRAGFRGRRNLPARGAAAQSGGEA